MTAQLDHIAQRPANGRIGQATAVEQSRAVAEVQAAIVVAQQCPRNVPLAIDMMRESCRRRELAERAFFSYPRGGNTIAGPSVHLARELARCWGNIQYGLREMRRDEEASEMLAFAWDVQTNSRCDNIVINPHRGYTGGRDLSELRDIYENNANVGARRVREAIFAVLPAWYVEEAISLCSDTLVRGNGKPLPQRVADAISTFGNLGVSVAQLEQRIGAPSAKWNERDVAQLLVIHRSVIRGELAKDEAFPQERLTAADITGKREPENPTPAAPAAATEHTDAPAPARTAQPAAKTAVDRLDKLVRTLDLGPDDEVRALFEWLTGEPWIPTRSQVDQAHKWLADHLSTAQEDVLAASGAAWKQYHEANPQAGDDSA